MNNLMYATYTIRLNICFNVQCLSRMNMNLFKKTFVVVKKIFRYFKKNIDIKIIYDRDIEFEKFIDTNWTNELISRHFIDIYVFMFHENVINWFFKLQICVALSLYEIEYMIQTQNFKKIIWISRFFKKFDINFDLSNIFVIIKIDNQNAIALIKNFKFHFKTKHIDVQWHFVKKTMQNDLMQFEYCFINEMIVDEFIKILNKIKFEKFIKMIDLTSIWID